MEQKGTTQGKELTKKVITAPTTASTSQSWSRSSRVVTKSVVTSSKVTKVSGKTTQGTGKVTSHESKNLLSETSWASSFQEGQFGKSFNKKIAVAKSSNESKELKGFPMKIDDQRALHLRQGARPKTTNAMHLSAGLESHLDPSFNLHNEMKMDMKIPSMSSAGSFDIKSVWDEGFSMFPEYFQDFHTGMSLQGVEHPMAPLKETKMLTAKQYSWEKVDNNGEEETEAEKIANSWLKIFGENEPNIRGKDIDRRAIKNS